jgi:DNA-binding NarL/FixJ family response regulator
MVQDSVALVLLSPTTTHQQSSASMGVSARVLLLPPQRSATIRACSMAIAERFQLTGRQGDVLVGVFAGESNATIADRIGIATCTVRTHIKAILRKTARKDRLALVGLLFDIVQPAIELDAELN